MQLTFQKANVGLALLHGAMALALAPFLAKAGSTSLHVCTADARETTRAFFEVFDYDCRPEGKFNVGVPIIVEGFFTASAHALYAAMPAKFLEWTKNRNINFWVEYSVSATIILLVVQTFTGLLQPISYVQNALSAVAMMMVPVACNEKRPAAAVVGMGIYLGIIIPFIMTVVETQKRGAIPDIALAMFSMLLVLYSTFPALHYWARWQKWTRTREAKWLMLLSLLSKTILRGLIAGAIVQ